MRLCENCMTVDRPDSPVKPFEVGPDQGNQQDPYRARLDLCGPCSVALQEGDLSSFNAWYKDSKSIERKN